MNTLYNFTKSDTRGDGAENWTAAQQIKWLKLLANGMKLTYKSPEKFSHTIDISFTCVTV